MTHRGGWTAAVAEAAAALNQLGYGAGPAATAPPAPAAPAAGDPALASALASLGLTPGSLANIPGLESLANVPGLESLLGLPQAVGSTGVGIVPSRSRVKGKGFPPKGGKGTPKGKPSLQARTPLFSCSFCSDAFCSSSLESQQDLPVLTSQEVQAERVSALVLSLLRTSQARSRKSSSLRRGRRTKRSAERCWRTRSPQVATTVLGPGHTSQCRAQDFNRMDDKALHR